MTETTRKHKRTQIIAGGALAASLLIAGTSVAASANATGQANQKQQEAATLIAEAETKTQQLQAEQQKAAALQAEKDKTTAELQKARNQLNQVSRSHQRAEKQTSTLAAQLKQKDAELKKANAAKQSALKKAAAANNTTTRATSSGEASTNTNTVGYNSCPASHYDEPQMTATGEQFDPTAMTAAHKTLPLGSRVNVVNPDNGKQVIVRINDRGPYVGDRCLDLSTAAFTKIANPNQGVADVKWKKVG